MKFINRLFNRVTGDSKLEADLERAVDLAYRKGWQDAIRQVRKDLEKLEWDEI